MAVALLFTGLTRHPKIRRAGEKAGWLFICCLEYSAEFGTDGFIPTDTIGFGLTGTSARLKALLMCDERLGPLLRPVDGGYVINDYLEWNRTAQQLEAARQKTSKSRAAAGKTGAAKRWGGKLDSKADGIATGITKQPDGSGSGPGSGPSGGLDGPSTTPKRRASQTATTDHHEDQPIDPLIVAVVEQVCSRRPEWKPILVRGAAAKAVNAAVSIRSAALALLCVASDPKSQQPIRVLSPGWWWDENDTRYQQAINEMESVA